VHELAITQSVLNIALEAAQQAGAHRVIDIHLIVGDLSTVVDDSVQFYFDFLSRGTAAEAAQLHFTRVAAEAACRDCGHRFPAMLPLVAACPTCSGVHLAVTGGREFRVESIEVDDGSAGPA
jgi:hydrogenase nickel incorporation protein HypA/HybF